MAILKGGASFTGSIDGLSAYTRKDSKEIFLRTKGGPSKARVKTAPEFELTRQNAQEMGGCAKATASIRQAIFPVKHLADYGFTGTLTALNKKIQLLDKVNKRGERSVLLAQYAYLLEGFHLNLHHTFDSVVRHPLEIKIDRATGSALITVPALLPGMNLLTPWMQPCFRLIFALGVIADRTFNGIDYKEIAGAPHFFTESIYTEWQHVQQPLPAQSFVLQLPHPEQLTPTHTLVLSAGIEMGIPVSNTYTKAVKAGCAKILAVG